MHTNDTNIFFKKYKTNILELFITYQWLETLLFMYLYFPGLKDKDQIELDKVNGLINKKTFGKMINKYLEKYPNDEKKLKNDLINVSKERNSFMHSFWISLTLMEVQDFEKIGKQLLSQFQNNADNLHKKISVLNKN